MPREDATAIGQRIRARREALRLRRQDVANGIGVDVRSVAGWEGGEGAPRNVTLRALADYLQTTADWIETGQEAKQPTPDLMAVLSERTNLLLRIDKQVGLIRHLLTRLGRLADDSSEQAASRRASSGDGDTAIR